MFDTVSIHGLSLPEWRSCSIEETLWRKTLPWMSPAQKRQLHELMPWKVLDCKCIRKQPSHWTFVNFFQDVLLKKLEPGANWTLSGAVPWDSQARCFLSFGGSLVYLFNFFFCYLLMQVEQICFLKKIKTTQFCQFRFTDVSISKQKPLMVLKVTQHCCNLHNISHDVFILRSWNVCSSS